MTKRILLVLVALLVVTPLATAGVGATIDTRDAELAVQQPAWVDSDVRTTQVNGTQTYVVEGDRVNLKPENFNSSNVVDYGLTTDAGRLEYDDELDVFILRPGNNTGTFEAFWVVNTTQKRTVTENNTSRVVTETVPRRYEANIRVDGGINTVHMDEGELEQIREYADLGRTVNATVGELRERNLWAAKNTGSDREIFESMVTRYINTGNPFNFFTGSYTQIALMLVITLGGAFWLAKFLGLWAFTVGRLKKKLNRHETAEAQEGELATRQMELDAKERRSRFQDLDWNEIYKDDHIASAFREVHGDNPHDGFQHIFHTQLLPEVWVKDRLAAMGASGYQARTERDDDGTLVDAELVEPDADDEDSDDVERISDVLDDGLVDVVDWESDTIQTFDIVNAEYDPSEIDYAMPTLELEELLKRTKMQASAFDDEQVAGQYLQEYIETVRAHPYTDTEGRPKIAREVLNNWLKAAELAGDRYQLPGTEIARQHIERALNDFDVAENARERAREVESGAY